MVRDIKQSAILAGVSLLLGACIQSGDTKCDWGDVYCPKGTVCNTPERQCVFQVQLDVCKRFPDFRSCYFPGQSSASHWCQQGVCVPSSGCGDLILDEGEACDDGNTLAGDGCSADCLSQELCGDGHVDLATGEECDDGNLRSRDGCNSRCRQEVADWTPWRSPFTGGRSGHSMVYDAARNRVVLFGGWDGDQFLSDTWEHDGLQWRAVSTPMPPPPRHKAGMVYDSVRQLTVLFGGRNTDTLNDTWEYDGVSWVARTDISGEPARHNHAMAYDAGRGRVVLHGGLIFDGSDYTWASDTREFDGVSWRDSSPPTGPPELQAHAMVYDAARGNVLLFGGIYQVPNDYEMSDESWVYDGSTWAPAPQTGLGPGERYELGLTYDASRQRVVLYGGGNFEEQLDDTWEYDGVAWSEVTPPLSPSPRTAPKLVYDQARNVTVAFGGYRPFAEMLGDTWELDGAVWTDVTPPAAPPARGYFGMAHDSSRQLTVLFGGTVDRTSALGDTWEFDGRGWVETSPAGSPPPREQPTMVYDAFREQIVMFGGGSVEAGTLQNDTWRYVDGQWEEVLPAQSPSSRTSHTMAYDPIRDRVVLFGGRSVVAFGLSDTWEFDGSEWERMEPPQSPSGRFWHSMAYDASRKRIVLFGGFTADGNLNDLWVYDGSTWQQIPLETAPTGRFGAGLQYDDNTERLLLHGGTGTSGGAPYHLDDDTWALTPNGWLELVSPTSPQPRGGQGVVFDRTRRTLLMFGGIAADTTLWEYRHRSADPDEQCANDADDDGDGLVDCEDPDCYLAASCQPSSSCGSTPSDPHAGCADPSCGGRVCAGTDYVCVADQCRCRDGALEKNCSDQLDDDCDDAVDCDDADCLQDAYCGAGGACQIAAHMTCGDTVFLTNDTGNAAISLFACAEYGTPGPEVYVHFIPRRSGSATITLSDLYTDLDLFVLATTAGGACDLGDSGCLGASQNESIDQDSVVLDVVAHQSYIIAVDAPFEVSVSHFTLDVSCD